MPGPWVEYRRTGDDLFYKKARIAIDAGYWFGKTGKGFMRMNIACPKSMLKEGLERLKDAVVQL